MAPDRPILVTGSAGFIGSNFVRLLLRETGARIVSLDALTYAGNLASLFEAMGHERHRFTRCDINDGRALAAILEQSRPRAVVHFAAESHVDYSIESPAPFIAANVTGVFSLLEVALQYWRSLGAGEREAFRFVHVSTDEVFGDLGRGMVAAPPAFEGTRYRPSSPYAATKAASDHLVGAWHRTYGLPTIITNCTNNYGPAQHPEKLIPRMISQALAGESLTVHGDGSFVRDWIHVEDHCRAVLAVLECGRPGAQYCVGARDERSNIDVIRSVCAELDRCRPRGAPYFSQVVHIEERLGQDKRYALNPARVMLETGWVPQMRFPDGVAATVRWYLDNEAWVEAVVARDRQEKRA